MSDNATGNIFWWATVASIPTDEGQTSDNDKLCDPMKLVRESIKGFDNECEDIAGRRDLEPFLSSSIGSKRLRMHSLEVETYAFTSWTKILNEVHFGWGRPCWIGVMGKVGPTFRNLTVFLETQWGKGIEAWVTSEEKQIVIMEKEPQFLAFASPNLHILSM
ncbi:putative alcohol O-acetyltransferase [Rosa chinensis]|uniref:Putative alcohol O-acetyltransferase n=1 Tax=Rosa chinensis TaxID=74649 RepID=A0A2P6P771_ROSCH|nr:BAHD acyltransferase At5g47980 [Rosa chinensis]PRQ17785.1 putative alcohol O-acetyltransferase [Rosa chinensis]